MTIGRFGLLATVISFPLLSAAQGVTIYGNLDVGVSRISTPAGKSSAMVAGGLQPTYMGFRGREDLGGGMSAGFDLEMGFAVDSGQTGLFPPTGQFFGRKSNVWIAGPFGEVRLGQQPNVAFYSLFITDPRAAASFGSALNGFSNNGGTVYVSNAISYLSPDISGLRVRAQYVFGEQSNSISNGSRQMLEADYAFGATTVTASWYSNQADASSLKNTGTVVGARHQLGNFTLKAFYSKFKNDFATASPITQNILGSRINYWGVGGVYHITPLFSVDVGYFSTRNKIDPSKFDSDSIGVGAYYSLSKRTSLYAQWSDLDNKGRASFFTNAVAPTPLLVGAGHSKGITAGIVHKF